MRNLLGERYYRNYMKGVKLSAIWFIIIMLLVTVVVSFNIGGVVDSLNKFLMDTFGELLKNISPDGQINFFALFKNNVLACFIMFLVGIVPFICLPLTYGILINAAIIGILIGAINAANGFYAGLMTFILGILPHGIFELPAFFFSAGAGVELCRAVNRKITNKETDVTIKDAFLGGLKAFVTIVVPLLLIAALIETYLTIKILTTFSGI